PPTTCGRRGRSPSQWIWSHAYAYMNLPTRDRGENLKRAITCYEAALRIYTERDFPQEWASTQNNLDAARAELESLTPK
ncbi:MAG: hypothetical protein ACLQBA_11600, partial [Candidatus Binataceae bacterium]